MLLKELMEKEKPSCTIASSILNPWVLETHMFHCVNCRKWLTEQEKVYGRISFSVQEEQVR